METQEKIKAILEAVENGISKSALDPDSKGSTIVKIKKGIKSKPETIDRIYNNLLNLQAGKANLQAEKAIEGPEKESITPSITVQKDAIAPSITEERKVMERIEVLEQENAELKNRLAELTKTVESIKLQKESITPSVTLQRTEIPGIKIHESRNCLGFSISKDSKGRHYGVKRINGTLTSVYIGKDLSKAEQKIKSYCEKKGTILSEKK